MPVVAVSPPLIFGGTPTPVPPARTPTPIPGRTPVPPVSTPTPAPTVVPIGVSGFVIRHAQFITRVDGIGSCFKRDVLSDFTDQEFLDHSQLAIQDKYLTQEEDMYCSNAGVSALAKALKRLGV